MNKILHLYKRVKNNILLLRDKEKVNENNNPDQIMDYVHIMVLLCSENANTLGISRAVRVDNNLGVELEIIIEGRCYGSIYEKIISDPLSIMQNNHLFAAKG